MKNYDAPIVHALFWSCYLIIAILVYGHGTDDWIGTCFETIYSHLVSVGVFYSTAFFAFPKLFAKSKIALFSSSLFAILFASILLRFLFIYVIFPEVMGRENSSAGRSMDYLVPRFFFQWFIFSLYAMFYWGATTNMEKARREKLELEIAALRAQINPHFIINSLELFRAQSADSDPKLSNGIGWFMKILHSGLVNPDRDGKIRLEVETDAILGTIYIFKERFPDIELEHTISINDIDDYRILPHIMLPIVENAFKHGAYFDKGQKIKIDLEVENGVVNLLVSNKKGNRIKDRSTGIGLRYVKRQLENGYPNKHTLIINETEETFAINLSVQL